jgi:hypothetical protein
MSKQKTCCPKTAIFGTANKFLIDNTRWQNEANQEQAVYSIGLEKGLTNSYLE